MFIRSSGDYSAWHRHATKLAIIPEAGGERVLKKKKMLEDQTLKEFMSGLL